MKNRLTRKLTFLLALVMMLTAIMPMGAAAQGVFPAEDISTPQQIDSLVGIEPMSSLRTINPRVSIGAWTQALPQDLRNGTITGVRIVAHSSDASNAPRHSGNSANVSIINVPTNGMAVTLGAIVYVRPRDFPQSLFTMRVAITRQAWVTHNTVQINF